MFRYSVYGDYHVREDFAIPVLESSDNKIWSNKNPATLVTPNVGQDSKFFSCPTKLQEIKGKQNPTCTTDKYNLKTCKFKYECVNGTERTLNTPIIMWQTIGPKCDAGKIQTEDVCCPRSSTHLIKEKDGSGKIIKYCATENKKKLK